MFKKVRVRDVSFSLSIDNGQLYKNAKEIHLIEPENFDFIDSLTKNDLYIDIGACEGRYTLYAACKGIPFYAIEPENKNFETLVSNLKRNNFNIGFAKQFAVGLHTHKSYLQIGQNYSGGHLKIVEDSSSRNEDKNSKTIKQPVQVINFDEFILINNLKPTAIKVDVDGSEYDFLYGATTSLTKYIQKVLIELKLDDPKFTECKNILKECGFKQIDTYNIDTSPGYVNILFGK